MTEAPLTALIAQVSEVVGRTLSAEAIALMAARLEREDRAFVTKALIRCMDECKGRLALADILDRMPSRPTGADAAWELAIQLDVGNEDRTVVAPLAILTAFPCGLWNSGDKIAARMAFKDAFPAAQAAHGMDYIVSLGNDPYGREPAIMEAVRRNLITSETALLYLPHMAMEIAALGPPSETPLVGGHREKRTQQNL